MNQHLEANLNRMANDVHLVTSPIRWIVDFIKFVAIFCLAMLTIPFIVVGLIAHHVITGQNILDADGILALKVLYTFCAPVLTCVGYRFCQAVSGRRARVKATYEFSMHKVFLIDLALMVFGALIAFKPYCDMSTDMGLVALVLYLSSPMLLLFVKRTNRFSGTPRCSKTKCLWSS
jgi:hypothetical protein